MKRKPRDRDAERTAIRAATNRLLAGTPLRSGSGKLTGTELIVESGLRRDVVYEHADLVEEFKARVRAQHSTPTAMQDLTEKYAAVRQDLAAAKDELARQRTANSVLRRVVVELSLELEQAKDELAVASTVTRLPAARNNSTPPACADTSCQRHEA